MPLKVCLLAIYLFLYWLYVPLSRRPVKYYWQVKFDKKIPLVPAAIIPYLSYYFFFNGGIAVLFFSDLFLPFIRAMIIAQVAADLFWLIFPNGVKRPEVNGRGKLNELIRRLYRFNKEDANGAPSAHVFHVLTVGFFLAKLFPPVESIILTWAGLIALSTVLTKQHYILDLAGGILVALFALRL